MTDETNDKDETQNPPPEGSDGTDDAKNESTKGATDAQADTGSDAGNAGEESAAAESGDGGTGKESAAAESSEEDAKAETETDAKADTETDAKAGSHESSADSGDSARADAGDATPAADAATASADGTDDEDMDEIWAEALAETKEADVAPPVPEPSGLPAAAAHPVEFPDLGAAQIGGGAGNIDLLLDVKLPVSIELGCTTQPISDILKWGQGSIVELDKLAGEPVNLLVNNKLVAKGEVVVVDENFGLRITSLVAGKNSNELR